MILDKRLFACHCDVSACRSRGPTWWPSKKRSPPSLQFCRPRPSALPCVTTHTNRTANTVSTPFFFAFGQSWNGVRILNSRISVPACSHSHVIPSVTLSSDRFCASVSISSQDLLPGYLSCKCVSPAGLDLKSMDGSRPGSRLPDSPAPPCTQQDIKIKQEPKTPIAPKKTQVCEETTMLLETLQPHRTFVWFVYDLSSSI